MNLLCTSTDKELTVNEKGEAHFIQALTGLYSGVFLCCRRDPVSSSYFATYCRMLCGDTDAKFPISHAADCQVLRCIQIRI